MASHYRGNSRCFQPSCPFGNRCPKNGNRPCKRFCPCCWNRHCHSKHAQPFTIHQNMLRRKIMSERIKSQHQQRLAGVYIRQSGPGQVKNHRESYASKNGSPSVPTRSTGLTRRSKPSTAIKASPPASHKLATTSTHCCTWSAISKSASSLVSTSRGWPATRWTGVGCGNKTSRCRDRPSAATA